MGIPHPHGSPHAVLPRSPTPPVSASPSTSDREDEEGERSVGEIDFDSDIFSLSKKQASIETLTRYFVLQFQDAKCCIMLLQK